MRAVNRKDKNMIINTLNSVSFKHNNINNTSKAKTEAKAETKASVKAAAVTGSTIGTVLALTLISRGHGVKIPSTLKNPHQLLRIIKEVELKEKDVIAISASSIAGGFLGGVMTDGKNTKAKAKEGIVQLFGNYIVPTIAVGGGIKLNKALNKKFNFPPVTRAIQFLFGFASLIAGVASGSKVSRQINSKIFKEEDYRKLTWKDWAVQFDNVCLVTSVSNAGTAIAKMASRLIPFAHLFPGYQVGIKRQAS